MPKLYLRPIADSSQFSDFSEYQAIPFPAPEGLEWIEGTPPAEATIYRKKTLAEQLNEVFQSLTAQERAQFYPFKAAVKIALEEGDLEAGVAIITGTEVPPHLEIVKDAMLALLGQS